MMGNLSCYKYRDDRTKTIYKFFILLALSTLKYQLPDQRQQKVSTNYKYICSELYILIKHTIQEIIH